jgi:hypothetical protein
VDESGATVSGWQMNLGAVWGWALGDADPHVRLAASDTSLRRHLFSSFPVPPARVAAGARSRCSVQVEVTAAPAPGSDRALPLSSRTSATRSPHGSHACPSRGCVGSRRRGLLRRVCSRSWQGLRLRLSGGKRGRDRPHGARFCRITQMPLASLWRPGPTSRASRRTCVRLLWRRLLLRAARAGLWPRLIRGPPAVLSVLY